jgi:hypothetical protein
MKDSPAYVRHLTLIIGHTDSSRLSESTKGLMYSMEQVGGRGGPWGVNE